MRGRIGSGLRLGILAAVGVVTFGGICTAVVKAPAKPKPQKLTILYTGDESGQIRSCNCSKFRYGGYSREATAVKNIRGEAPDVVIVGGGDYLGTPDSQQDLMKADVAARAMKLIGYNAVVPGEADLSFGATRLASYQTVSGASFVAGNIRASDGPKTLFSKSYTVVRTPGGLRIAVLGVVDPGVLSRDGVGESEFSASEPLQLIKKIVPKVRSGADVVLVVAHTTRERGKLLASVPGVDVVLLSHREAESVPTPAKDQNTVELPVEKVGSCLLIKSQSRMGWSLGRLDLTLAAGKVKDGKNRLIYLDRSFEEDPEIIKVYDDYNTKVQDLVTNQQKQLRDQVLASLAKRGIDPAQFKRPKPFATSEACKSCHAEAYDTWTKTRHASAFASLENRKQQFDPECVSCHTTGLGVRGGFTDAKNTPEFVNVGCEACHGAGARHAEAPSQGYGATGEENCRGCHTEDYNPDFNYEQMWKAIAH